MLQTPVPNFSRLAFGACSSSHSASIDLSHRMLPVYVEPIGAASQKKSEVPQLVWLPCLASATPNTSLDRVPLQP